MYSFRQRSDTLVADEPLYGHYLRVSGASHPGREEVLGAMDTDGNRVMRQLLDRPIPRPVLLLKQMAHHLQDLDRAFLSRTVNVLLIRDPAQMLPSLRRQIPEPTLRDTGLQIQWHLLEYLQGLGQEVAVLDSRDLLLDPPRTLGMLCDAIGVAFQASMLSWPRGPKPEDGVWAPHWYHNVHRSTGFQPYRAKRQPFPRELEPLLEECSEYYQQLKAQALAPQEIS
jgi:hypothetical protein